MKEVEALKKENQFHEIDSYLTFLRNDANFFRVLVSKKNSTQNLLTKGNGDLVLERLPSFSKMKRNVSRTDS